MAISADRPEKLDVSVEKHGLTYALLSDNEMEAAQAFGVAFRIDAEGVEMYRKYDIDLEEASGRTHHILPVPSVFIVDAKGTVRFTHSDPDYKKRIDPDVLLEEAKAAL